MDSKLEQNARQVFKSFNPFMLLLWQLGLGKLINFWPPVVGRTMVLTHTGRKSGLPRRTPLNYAIVDGVIYAVAGFGGVSDWYRNIQANPCVQIWLPDSWHEGRAEEVNDPQNRLKIIRAVLIASGFAANIAGLDPHTLRDAELDSKAKEYRILRVTPTAPRTGPGGPGELAWIWPLATFLLLPLALRKRSRRRCC